MVKKTSKLQKKKPIFNDSPKEFGIFQAEQLLDVAYIGKKLFYKVKWQNFQEKDCTWEPATNLANFKPQIIEIRKKIKPIPKFLTLKQLLMSKPKEIFQVKTEEFIKKLRKTGIHQRIESDQVRNSNSIHTNPVEPEKIDFQQSQILNLNNIKVIDLQQVYHLQTKRIHVLARVIRKFKNRESVHWTNIKDLRKTIKSLQLLTDFLVDNVQFESKVQYVDQDDPRQEFREVNFHQ